MAIILSSLNGSERAELYITSKEPYPHCIRCTKVDNGDGGVLHGSTRAAALKPMTMYSESLVLRAKALRTHVVPRTPSVVLLRR
ncbi:hypothetical protein P7K49_029285 [Saguinus oedipus]|uniref:Uncharacterized protein n=1 Tax=Saguinus oedipus TaxID=9490 RepID=A0ABQ9U6S9_SAGOE|nr:hypothetical protein P7K49_029285 [Saguinus oedipus]